MELFLYLLYMCCFLLLYLLLNLWWSGRCELHLELLDLLLVLIDFLHNMINLLCHHEFGHLQVLWDFIIGYDQFLFQPIHMVLLTFCLKIILLEYQFQHISIFFYLLQFCCICACVRLYLLYNVYL